MISIAWIATALLGVVLVPAGLTKVTQPATTLIDNGLTWVVDFPIIWVRAIGALEVLAVVGLVVPPLLDVAAGLAVVAAAGVVALMVGAAITHARRGETKLIGLNVAVVAGAAAVIWGRIG